MINDPLKMLRGLIVLAPELNAKVALLNLVEYVDDVIMDIPEDQEHQQIRVEDILNVLAESLVKLHHHVYDNDYSEFPVVGGSYDKDKQKSKEEQIDEFRRILGLMPEKDENNKEENND